MFMRRGDSFFLGDEKWRKLSFIFIPADLTFFSFSLYYIGAPVVEHCCPWASFLLRLGLKVLCYYYEQRKEKQVVTGVLYRRSPMLFSMGKTKGKKFRAHFSRVWRKSLKKKQKKKNKMKWLRTWQAMSHMVHEFDAGKWEMDFRQCHANFLDSRRWWRQFEYVWNLVHQLTFTVECPLFFAVPFPLFFFGKQVWHLILFRGYIPPPRQRFFIFFFDVSRSHRHLLCRFSVISFFFTQFQGMILNDGKMMGCNRFLGKSYITGSVSFQNKF